VRILNKIKIPDSLTKILNFIAYNRLLLGTFVILVCCVYIIKVLVEDVSKESGSSFQSFIYGFISDHKVFFLVLIVVLLLFVNFQLICPTKCNPALSFITTNWIVLSAIILFLGCLYYNIPPLYSLDDARYNHHQEILKRNYIEFHNDLGIRLLNARQITSARDEFKKVLDIDKLNQDATKGLFECDVFRSIWNESTDPEVLYMELTELRKKDHKDALPLIYLGDFASAHPDSTDNATEFYKEALEKDPENAAASESLGYLYDQTNQSEAALKMFFNATKLSRWNVLYQGNLAYKHYEIGEYETAIDCYHNTIILDPKSLDLYIGLSNSYRCLGDLKNAIKNQEKQIKLMEDNSTKDLVENHRDFYYRNNSENSVPLQNYNEKKHYFYYNIALTYYLLDKNDTAADYVKKANDLQDLDPESKLKIKGILNFDIETLQTALKTRPEVINQPKLINKTLEFQNKFV